LELNKKCVRALLEPLKNEANDQNKLTNNLNMIFKIDDQNPEARYLQLVKVTIPNIRLKCSNKDPSSHRRSTSACKTCEPAENEAYDSFFKTCEKVNTGYSWALSAKVSSVINEPHKAMR